MSTVGDNVHQEILQEFTSYVASLSDEDKLGMIFTYSWFGGLIRTFTFEFGAINSGSFECVSTQERLKLFEKCPKVTTVIIRRKNPFSDDVEKLYSRLITAIAIINQSLVQIVLEVIPGPSEVPMTDGMYNLNELKTKYYERVLQLDPTYDSTTFPGVNVYSCKMRELGQKYPHLKLDRPKNGFPANKIRGAGVSTVGYSRDMFKNLDHLDRYPILDTFELDFLSRDKSLGYEQKIGSERKVGDTRRENVSKIAQDLFQRSLGRFKEFTFSEYNEDEKMTYRIFQLKGDLLIVSNRYNLPLNLLPKVFPNVSKLILELLEGQNGMTEKDVKDMINILILDGSLDYQVVKGDDYASVT